METDINIKKEWVYVVVQDPETPSEELMGFNMPYYKADNVDDVKTPDKATQSFIPAFETKEEAQQCFLLMPKDLMKRKYEIQAIIKDDLLYHAKTNGYKVFMMDEKSHLKREVAF
ncbi:MAG: hypothetical protein HQK63_08535 [Desulfamplus sp.]|nr:hypothetical protein [Desulfamplus sp.]